MKIKCHNQTCQHIWEYNGKLPYTDCPVCTSKIPIPKLVNEFTDTAKNIEKINSESDVNISPIKNHLRLHYKIFLLNN